MQRSRCNTQIAGINTLRESRDVNRKPIKFKHRAQRIGCFRKPAAKKTVPNFQSMPNKIMGTGIYTETMNDQNPEDKRHLNLTAALRIIQNAGLPDPRLKSDDPDAQIQNIIDALCDLSTHDGLTGLVNAVFFHAILSREIDRSRRTGRTCGLLVIDIDHFKQINDTYGHCTGDKALQSVAEQMKLSLRSMDTAARIGGEEFAIILPECSPEDAVSAATRIHSMLNPLILKLGKNTLRLTTSGGLVWTNQNTPASSVALVAEADQEMYRAKWAGRGRLCYKHMDSTLVSRQERSVLLDLKLGDGINGH
jgi:diguanylate cyclase (GGDEF)-like protein